MTIPASEPLAATRQQDSSALPSSVSGDIHLPATMPNIVESDDSVDDGDFIPETTPELAMQTGMDCFSCGNFVHAKRHLKLL